MGRCSCTTPNSGSKGTCTAAQSALQWSGSDIPLSVGKSSTWSPEGRTTIMLGCKETAFYSMYCCFGAFNAGGLLPAVPKPVALIYSLTSLSFCMRCIPSLGFLGESVFCISLLNISWIQRMFLQESSGFCWCQHFSNQTCHLLVHFRNVYRILLESLGISVRLSLGNFHILVSVPCIEHDRKSNRWKHYYDPLLKAWVFEEVMSGTLFHCSIYSYTIRHNLSFRTKKFPPN